MHRPLIATLFATTLLAACTTSAPLTPAAPVAADAGRVGIEGPSGRTEVPELGTSPDWVIAIHGGAGVMSRDRLTPEREAAYRADLARALEAGGAVLARGGDGADAVEAALIVLEESPLFNAGIGAVLDSHGQARHDASIMRGDTRDAGAIAGSRRIRNPITAAKAVMEETENVLLAGDGADWFAVEQGLTLASPLDFETPARRDSMMRKRQRDPAAVASIDQENAWQFGTVGAVVLDRNGTIHAGTSTGGRTYKRYGRIGDSPIIGAGTFAANESCAVSATGHGEYFMRWTVARDVCARMELVGEDLPTAAHNVVVETLGPIGGGGAVIAIAPDGTVAFSMNQSGMYRGAMSSETAPRTAIFAEDDVR